jgi:hypothetical protein
MGVYLRLLMLMTLKSYSSCHNSEEPNVVVNWLTFPLCIRELPDSNLGPNTAILNEVFRGFPLSLQTNRWIVTTIDSFHRRGNSLLQISFVSTWISECNMPLPTWISLTGIWSEPGDIHLFSFPVATSTSDMLDCGTNVSAVCVYVCLIPPPPHIQ